MKLCMKTWVILVLLAALPWGLAAQNSSQQPLPTAPSATTFPPQQSAPPPSGSNQSATPAQSPASPAQPATSSALNKSTPAPGAAADRSTGKADNPDEEITVIRKRVNEVNVVFTVTDKRGHFIKDLTQNDFKVLDDGKPASLRYFGKQTNLPLRVGLLIDASTSVRDRFKFEQEAAIEFLNQIIRFKYDKAFVIGFDTSPEVTQDFTDNTEALSHGVRMLRPGGGTAMYDAIYFACRDKLMKQDQSRVATRRAIILLSDGEDNQSRVAREEAVEMAQRAEVVIYAISTNTSGLVTRGDKVLQHFADQTGGKAFFPFKIQDVADAFSQIQDELRSQYAIAYKPADFIADGRYRKIDIIADNKRYKVRARKGYYAPLQ
jgi:VWFA-related protein